MSFVRSSSVLRAAAIAFVLGAALPVVAAITVAPGAVTVPRGSESSLITATVTIAIGAGDLPEGVLEFDSLPPGVTTLPSPVTYVVPAMTSSTITTFRLSVAASAAPGVYPIAVRPSGSAGTDTIVLTITAPDFTLSLAQSSMTFCGDAPPAANSFTLTPLGGYSGTPALQWLGVPAGVVIQPLPPSTPPLPPARTVPFTVTAGAESAGFHTMTLVARDLGSGIQHTATLALQVTAPSFTPVLAPAAVTLVPGGPPSTVTASIVASECLSGTITADAPSLPAGVTMATLPATMAGPPYTPVALQLSATAAAQPGTATTNVSFTAANGLRRAVPLTITIAAPPDYSIHVTPAAVQVRSGATATVMVAATGLHGFASPINVTTPAVQGVTFAPAAFVLSAGGTQPVTITATNASPSPPREISFTATASGIGTRTAPLLLSVLAPNPRLLSVAPPAAVAGGNAQRHRVTAESLQPGAVFVFDDSRIRITAARILSATLAELEIAPHADVPAGAYVLRVTNPDGGRAPNPIPLLVYPPSSLAAPLGVTAAAIVFPASGASVANGESVYARGLLATTGSGTIVGSWRFDGVPFDRFTAVVSGGMPVEVRAHVPLPSSFDGGHRLELVVESPAVVSAPAIDIVIVPARSSRLMLLAPRDGAVLAAGDTLFRWSLVPNCGGYLVEIANDDARSGVPNELLRAHRFRVSAAEWRPSPEDVARIGFGVRRWRVSPVCSGTVADATPWERFAFLPERVALTLDPIAARPDGSVTLRWRGGPAGLLYRVEVSDPGDALLFAALTPRAEHVLDGRLLPPGTSIRVTAIAPGNVTLGVSAPQLTPRLPRRTPSIFLAQLAAFTLVRSEPKDRSTVTTQTPQISAAWREPVRPDQVAMSIDQTDVTKLSTIAPTSIVHDVLLPLASGPHTVKLTVGSQSATWQFTVDVAAAETTTPAPAQSRDDWALTPTGTVTAIRRQPDDARLRLSGQTDLAGTSTSLKGTGEFGMKQELHGATRLIQDSKNWVAQAGARQGTWEEQLTAGYTQPDFMDQTQFVTAGLAQGGAQARVRARYGTVSYWQTLALRPAGVASAFMGAEQKLRVISLQNATHPRWDVRLVGLGVDEKPGLSTTGGEGRALGLYARYQFRNATSLAFEGARGSFEPDGTSLQPKRDGNAFRMSLSGMAGANSYAVNVRRTDAGFVNPANRGFTAGGVPDRVGGDAMVSRIFGSATALTAQVTWQRDGTSSPQVLPSVRDRGLLLSLSTMLGSRISLSLTGNMNAQRGGAVPTVSLPRTDRRQSGATATVSETFGSFALAQTLQWQQMTDHVTPIANSTLKMATLTAAGTIHTLLTLSAVLSGTRNEGAPEVGRNDQLLATLQPMIDIPGTWISLQPRATWGRTTSSLMEFQTTIEQYGGLIAFAPPVGKSLPSLQLSAEWNRHRFTGQLEGAGFTRTYAATFSLAHSLGTIAVPGSAPVTAPYTPPSNPGH